MKRFLLTAFVWLVWANALLGSNSGIIEDLLAGGLDFSSLQPQYMSHGYLRDRCVEFTDISPYCGGTDNDSTFCCQNTFYDLLISAKTLSRTPATWNPSDIITYQNENKSLEVCPIAILQYMMIQIKENALTDSLIKIENGQVKDVFRYGSHVNPYENNAFLHLRQQTLYLTIILPSLSQLKSG